MLRLVSQGGRQESTHLRCARECPYSARAGKTGRHACSRGNARHVPRLYQVPPADRSQSRARQAAGSCAAPVERPYTGAWRRHVNVAIGRHVRARGDRVRLRALLRASGALARRVPSNIPRRHRPRVAGRLGMLDGTCRALTKRTLTARGCACRSSRGVRKVRTPALVCTILHGDSSLRQSNMLLGRKTDHHRTDDTRRAPPQSMSVNTGHCARSPGVLWYGRARARVLEYGFLSSYARFRIQRVRAPTRGSANARTRPQAERRQVSGLSPRDGKGGGISPVGV